MKSLVYLAAFRNPCYIKFLELFFSSVVLFNKNIQDTVDFLVITEESFQAEIQRISAELGIPIQTWILSPVENTFLTTVKRYTIFSWPQIIHYTRVMYCDTDILISHNLETFFNIIVDSSKIYTLKEGTIDYEYWGGDAIFDFQEKDRELSSKTPGICSGIFVFEVNIHIVEIFNKICHYIYEKIEVPGVKFPVCFDQPYFNYVMIKYNHCENESLSSAVVNRPPEIKNEIIIYHFPDVSFTQKYQKMIGFFVKLIQANECQTEKLLIIQEYINRGIAFVNNYNELSDPLSKPFTLQPS